MNHFLAVSAELASVNIDWAAMFTLEVSLLELFLRGTAMYLGIIALRRVFPRRKGALNAADLLVLLLVADAAQNGLLSD